MPARTALALLTFAALAGVAALAKPVGAQTPAPAAPAPPDANAPRRPQTLNEVKEELRWNVEQNGALLAIATTPAGWLRSQARNTTTPSLPPPAPGGLPMSALEAYFDRRIVPCGSIAAFAPTTMWVLNYKDLPKPSAYAGVEPQDRLRFLQASLTPAQWRKVASPTGLGADDLSAEQRELFLGMLSPGTTLYHKGEMHDITPAMAAGMRLHMARKVTYQFLIGNYPNNAEMPPEQTADESQIARPEDRRRRGRGRAQAGLLGHQTISEVPSRAKPTDLAFDWAGLDTTIALDGKTVGELVARIGKAAKIELFCDPRYRNLPVYTRGQSARAGDVLKAVCRGVNGTVRRVGGERGAFVITDDVIGLDTRRALIHDWVEQNTILIRERDRKIARALKEARPGNYLTYEPGDPFAPNETVLRLAKAHKPAQLTSQDFREPGGHLKQFLWVPVADLPPASQSIVRAQVAQLQKDAQENPQRAVRTDAVTPRFESETYFVFPGIGKVKAPGWGDVSQTFDEARQELTGFINSPWEKKPLTAAIPHRAVIAWMESKIDAQPIARAARRAGFTELWIDAPAGNQKRAYLDVLAAGIKAAKAEGLTARVMARPLREVVSAKDVASPLTPERNVRGETWSQQIARYGSRGDANGSTLAFDDKAEEATVANAARVTAESFAREARLGEWMGLPAAEQRKTVSDRIKAIAALPQVDGIVVRDLLPPGFEQIPSFAMNGNPPLSSLGYTLERRLRFLREQGADPVDFGLTRTSGAIYGPGLASTGDALNLPGFADADANEVVLRWDAMRKAEGARALQDLIPDLRRAVGNMPLWLYHSPTDPTGQQIQFIFAESLDKLDAPNKAFSTADAPTPDSPGGNQDPMLAATKRSSFVWMSLQCQPIGSPLSQIDQFLMEIAGFASTKPEPSRPNNGLIVDLNRRTPDAIRLHLEALPPFVPARAASAKP